MTELRHALAGVLARAAAAAAELGIGRVDEKSSLDYVTDVDRRIDALLTDALGEITPSVPVVSEERAPSAAPEREYWLIDPIDGTHNLLAGIPWFAVSAALLRGSAVELAGVAHVSTREVYVAERRRGAWLDGVELRVPKVAPALVALSTGAIDALVAKPDEHRALRAKAKVRNLGSQSLHLCAVARGQVAMAVSAEARVWDDAAGELIAVEAGAGYRSLAREGNFERPLRSVCAHPTWAEAADRLGRALFSGEETSE